MKTFLNYYDAWTKVQFKHFTAFLQTDKYFTVVRRIFELYTFVGVNVLVGKFRKG